MPRYCRVKAEAFSDKEGLQNAYKTVCESVIPILGIDPGSDDEEESWLIWAQDFLAVLLDPNSCFFQVFILFIVAAISFMLGDVVLNGDADAVDILMQ